MEAVQKEPVRHYTAYKPRPFRREERKDVTVLFGGLTWKHERLIQGVLHNMGYKAQPLPNIVREDLDAGKELIDSGACCPTTFTTGNLVRFLRERAAVEGPQAAANNYVFMTAGACGPCRFGQYHESYTMALEGLGLRDFRLFLLDQTQLDQGSVPGGGLEINLPFSLGLVWAILCGDLLTDLEYKVRPYEVNPGETDRVLRESVERMYEAFRDRRVRGKRLGAAAWHLLTRHFTSALHDVKRKFNAIEVDRLRVKPMVKITGEFWLQTHEGEGNYNIKQWLEQEGAEVIPPPVAVWLDYLLFQGARKLTDKGQTKKARQVRWIRAIYKWAYNRLRNALDGVPEPLPSQEEIARLANPFYNMRLDGGEGHMLVGKALMAHLEKHAHMICELSPYSCMPNTMSIGAMANVMGRYPDLLYAPIEVKGDAEIHALSRCQMVLTEAKKRAQKEYDEALRRSGLTPEQVRARAARRPELRRAIWRVPHHGCAGTAANVVLDLAR